ncbi:hypothetical protein VTK26DRAFT_7122 [Humicola hyalothermophila]
MAPIYKIAVIQIMPKDVAVEENFAKAASYIRKAAAQGAHLAVLPEYHLTSWCPDHPDFVSACAASAGYLARYQDLARELDINIVPGTICEVHPVSAAMTATSSTATTTSPSSSSAAAAPAKKHSPTDDTSREIRNVTYWIAASTGAIAGSYQKKNLWHTERPHLTAGPAHAPHAAFDTPLAWDGDGGRPIRAGLLICWDLAFPEAFRALVADGAELVVVPSFWLVDETEEELGADRLALNPRCERLFLETVMVTRAFENDVVVAFSNAGGCSQVAVPVVGVVGGGNGSGFGGVREEVMKVVEVDFEAVRVLERHYKVREDMKGAGWHYGYTLWKEDE